MLRARSWRTRWVKRNWSLSGSISTGGCSWSFIEAGSHRTLALPDEIEQWSLTTLREKLIKIGAKVVRHGRYITFQLAEVAIPRRVFANILRLIDDLRPAPLPP